MGTRNKTIPVRVFFISDFLRTRSQPERCLNGRESEGGRSRRRSYSDGQASESSLAIDDSNPRFELDMTLVISPSWAPFVILETLFQECFLF